jgi:hypothetical protein
MKQAKLLILLILVASLLALIWVNTGSRQEYGYSSCGNSTIFYPAGSLPQGGGGPCISTIPLHKSFTGRYENRIFIDEVFGVVICLSGAAYILLKQKTTLKN